MDISGIDCLGLDRVLRRESGKIIVERDDALFIRDHISGAYMLACEDAETGMAVLGQHIEKDCNLLMVSDHSLGNAAFERFGFSEKLDCYQVAYYGKKPSFTSELSIRAAEQHDLTLLAENYRLLSPEALEKLVSRESILLGYHQDRLIGFIGEHLEGSMGILYVFPEYRCRGYGTLLQKHLITKTMEEGYVPFGQVEKGNQASLNLQKKIGMTQSHNLIAWMWK